MRPAQNAGNQQIHFFAAQGPPGPQLMVTHVPPGRSWVMLKETCGTRIKPGLEACETCALTTILFLWQPSLIFWSFYLNNPVIVQTQSDTGAKESPGCSRVTPSSAQKTMQGWELNLDLHEKHPFELTLAVKYILANQWLGIINLIQNSEMSFLFLQQHFFMIQVCQ